MWVHGLGRRLRGPALLAACVLAAAGAAAAAPPAAAAATDRPQAASGVLGWLVDTAVCGTLTRSATVTETASVLGEALRLKGVPASMFETTVLAGVGVGCGWATGKVTKAMPIVLGHARSTRTAPTKDQFARL